MMFRLNIDEAGRFALPGFSFVETTLSSALSDHATSLPPEILEPIRRQGRVHRRARDRAMAKPPLDRLARAALPGQPQVGTSPRPPRWLIYAQPRSGRSRYHCQCQIGKDGTSSGQHWGHLAQLSQLEEKAEKNQRRLPEGLHYIEWVARRTGICGAVMRGGGWSGRLSLSWWARSF